MKYLITLLVLLSTVAFADTRVDSTMAPCPLLDSEYVAVPNINTSTRLDIAKDKLRDDDGLPDGIYHYVCDYKLTKYGSVAPEDPNTPVVTPPDPNSQDPNEPVVIPPDPNEPPVVSGPLDARYAALLESPNLHAYLPMNNPQDVCEYTRPCKNKGEINPHITYDAEKNAFMVSLSSASLNSKWQIRKYWESLDHRNANKVSFQWMYMMDDGYLSPGSGLQNHKEFQISGSSEQLQFEIQSRYSQTGPDAVAIPTVRSYRPITESEAQDKDPLSSWGPDLSTVNGSAIDNWQPGGDTAIDKRQLPFPASAHMNPDYLSPFIIRANTWVTITVQFEFIDNELRLRIWMSDDDTPPTLIIASVREPGKGFLLSNDTSVNSIYLQNWWLESNSSQTSNLAGPARMWVRNFLVYKDADIPLD